MHNQRSLFFAHYRVLSQSAPLKAALPATLPQSCAMLLTSALLQLTFTMILVALP